MPLTAFYLLNYAIRLPFINGLSEVNKVTSFSLPNPPKTKHSLIILAICFGGKLTTATICFPIKSSG